MKAGSKIIKATKRYIKINNKEANLEWFYNQENREKFSDNEMKDKLLKKMQKYKSD